MIVMVNRRNWLAPCRAKAVYFWRERSIGAGVEIETVLEVDVASKIKLAYY